MRSELNVGLLGFGEVGQTLADGLAARADVNILAYDILFAAADSLPGRAAADRGWLQAMDSPADLGAHSDLLVSAVTADQDLDAARSVTPALKTAALFVDVNSVAPATKRECSDLVTAAGGRYVEAAVMSPIAPRGAGSPMLLGGPHAEDFVTLAQPLGFSDLRVYSAEIGLASATKLCRSVLIKGLESLFTESMLAAHYYGVEDEVLGSLDNVLRGRDWRELATYLMQRSIQHGVRRAEEMRAAAATVADAGVSPAMTSACVTRQEWSARFPAELADASLDRILEALSDPQAVPPRGE